MPITTRSESRTNRQSIFVKSMSELDPENTSIPECEAALVALFKHHTKFQGPASRKPKLWDMNNGGMVLCMFSDKPFSGDTKEAYELGNREGQFMGELLATIPVEQRPVINGKEQRIISVEDSSAVKALATAIRTMVANHQYDIQMPLAHAPAMSR